MKFLIGGLAWSLGMFSSDAQAEVMIEVDGADYTLSALMENCQSLADDPAAQIACFTAVSKLVEEQSGAEPEIQISVPDALEALRTVAQVQLEETGLLVLGTDCNIQLLYYGNYYHLSRRNVSSIDMYSATFDASELQYDQVDEVRGTQPPLFSAQMNDGSTALSGGGLALESAQFNFPPKSARSSIARYGFDVAVLLAGNESQSFEFVLVHPSRIDASDDIQSAFEDFLNACNG